MAQTIAIINQKGGVGKSTTALALGQGLAITGKRVLFVDLDAQGNLSYTMQAHPGASSFDLLNGTKAVNTIQQTDQGDLIQNSPALSGADMAITATGKEFKLKEALIPVLNKYDYIIVDTPPALGILTINALTSADLAIIPAQADIYSLQGIGQLYSTIDAVRKYTNPNLKICGILLTRFSARSVLSRDIAEMIAEVAKELDTVVFEAKIRECIAIKESQVSQQGILSYAAKCNAAEDYQNFIDEFLLRS